MSHVTLSRRVTHTCVCLPDPFAVQAPDSVEHTISNASATCVRFNHGKGLFAGHYMAAGRTDGLVVVLSVETKGVLRMLEGHVKAVTSVRCVCDVDGDL